MYCYQYCLAPESMPPQGMVGLMKFITASLKLLNSAEMGHYSDCVISTSPADSLDEVEWQKRYVILAKDERRLYFFNDTEVRKWEDYR